MNVPWDSMREDHIRTVARAEATKITVGALTGIHEKIHSLWEGEPDGTAAWALFQVLGALKDTIREIQTLGYDTETQKPSDAVSRPVAAPADTGPMGCLNASCKRDHAPSGAHT